MLYIFNVLWYNTIKRKHIYFSKPTVPLTPSQKKYRRYIRENVLDEISNSCGFEIVDVKLHHYKVTYILKLK